MIEARGLSLELRAFSLRGIDLEISEGEYFVLLGPTGAGKTVLVECLVGLHTPRSGAIVLDGRDVTPAPPEARGVAYVPQDYCLFPNMTAARNIAFGLRHRGWSETAIRARVSELAGWLGLEPLLSRLPLTLSGGEKQRVALARALAIRPRLLLLDEPLAAVDPRTRDAVCDELKRIQREFGTTTIHVCHDFEEALAVADRLAVMNEGRIIQAGTPENVFRKPETEFTARFTGAVNVFPCEWGDGQARLGGLRVPAGGAPGGRGWFVCRPEHVEIRPLAPAAGSDGFFTGTVIRILDKGPYRRIDIESAGFVFSASLDHRDRPGLPLAPGFPVEFGFPAEKIVLIPDPSIAPEGSRVEFGAPMWHKIPKMKASLLVRTDCVHFAGEKPCRFRRVCDDCPEFKPFGPKILVIKCRAQGDVLRTTPVLAGIKRKYPDAFITWVVDEESLDLLRGIPLIDRLLPINAETALALQAQRFDAVYSLDKDPGLVALAGLVSAPRKYGFALNEHGNLAAFTPAAAFALRLGVDDDLKFRVNQKSYQHMLFDAVELAWRNDDYAFVLPEGARAKAAAFFKSKGVPKGRPNIGLNTGAGAKFTTKQWPERHFLELIRLLKRGLGANVFLLGGRREEALNRRLAAKAAVRVFDTGTDNSLLDFAGYLDRMDAVVCSDTLAMHIALALKKKTVVLFGPTCPQEIEVYGRGVKLFAGAACAPCYKQSCPDPICMEGITPARVLEAVRGLL